MSLLYVFRIILSVYPNSKQNLCSAVHYVHIDTENMIIGNFLCLSVYASHIIISLFKMRTNIKLFLVVKIYLFNVLVPPSAFRGGGGDKRPF